MLVVHCGTRVLRFGAVSLEHVAPFLSRYFGTEGILVVLDESRQSGQNEKWYGLVTYDFVRGQRLLYLAETLDTAIRYNEKQRVDHLIATAVPDDE